MFLQTPPEVLPLHGGEVAPPVVGAALLKVAGGSLIAPLAGVVVRTPPEGVGGDVAGGQLLADLPEDGADVPLQPAQPLRRDQGVPGDGPVRPDTRTGRKRMPASPGCSMAASTWGSSSTSPFRLSSLSTERRRSASVMPRLPATMASRAGR